MSTNITDDDIMSSEGKALNTFFIVLSSVFILPTILGNSLILISIARFRYMRRIKHYVMIGNLAVSDLLIGVIVLPLEIVFALEGKISENPSFIRCLLINCTVYTCIAASVLNLFILSLERFHAIRYPLLHPFRVTRRRIYAVIACSWIFIIVLGFYPLFGYKQRETLLVVCMAKYVYTDIYRRFFISIVLFCIFASCALYFTIFKIALGKMREFTDVNSVNPSRQLLRKDLRHSRVMLLISGLFVLFWGPYCVSVILTVNKEHLWYIRHWFSGLGLINSCINWIVFAARLKKFKEAFKNILNCSFLNPEFQLRSSSTY